MGAGDQTIQLPRRFPHTLVVGTAIEFEDTYSVGAYARLEENGHQLGHFAERVTNGLAMETDAQALQLSPGNAVLTITRTAHDTSGTPVEVNDMVLTGDRYELLYELPAN